MYHPDPAETGGRKPKILFVALAQSSHTHSWVELLSDSGFDVRIFGVTGTVAPSGFPFQVYSTGSPRQRSWAMNYLRWRIEMVCNKIQKDAFRVRMLDRLSQWFGHPEFWFAQHENEWLSLIIRHWRPDIIHTLGFDPASYVYRMVRERFGLAGIGKWVATARGGSDFALVRHDPVCSERIKHVLAECDHFIADNGQTYAYATELGLERRKVIPRKVTPGTGGIDADRLHSLRRDRPSSQRTILIPKAYECPYSKALPVFEALKLCWERIEPCTVHLTAHDEETLHWFRTLPDKIRSRCVVEGRVPRERILSLMAQARIVLAPSLIDGIPNTLYEAMATGAFPIFSPLDSFRELVRDGENILFARNLYPEEIAGALVRGMTDDALVDRAAEMNLSLVRELADRREIGRTVLEFYRSLVDAHIETNMSLHPV